MSVVTPPQPGTIEGEAISPLSRECKLTVERYYQMIETKVLREDEPVFLWKGRLVGKMTKGRPHTIALTNLYRQMIQSIPEGWYVEQEQPMVLGEDGVPEPDLKVVRGTPNDYPRRPPTTMDVALIVEVADSSLVEDLGDVLETYASQSIPIYWVVNLRNRRLEVYRDPTGPVEKPFYRTAHLYGPNDEVPVEIDGREVGRIAVASILP